MATPFVLDAAAVLGLGTPSADPLPPPEAGWVVLRIPDNLTLQALRDSPVGKELMWQHGWYDQYPWSSAAPPAGDYALRLPVPSSRGKTLAEQQALLPPGEEVAPVVLVAAALLCIKLQDGRDPLNTDATRCKEQASDGDRVLVHLYQGRVLVNNYWDDYRHSYLWLSAARKAS